jgi:hypothetical protein
MAYKLNKKYPPLFLIYKTKNFFISRPLNETMKGVY